MCVQFAGMRRSAVERSLRDVHARLVRVRQELSVLEEQLAVLNDAAEDARIRSLVSETPLAAHEYADAQRTADAANRERAALVATMGELEHRQDELLGKLAVEPR
jgi:chromosome segregation ATPase